MPEVFELIMVLCFGVSWPVSIAKSWKCRTAKGKSPIFLVFIIIGYLSGIVWKLLSNNITYVFWFYVLNLLMVAVDLCLYFRNARLDRLAAEQA
ncbi:MAG TPA: hypothetical protein PK629_05250 [Oscillospiraceae bacterium]|nr:hypothetical protein [Oscillospiraceae bacterium]HPF57122.1 hypothetical protein [Clostridiales bacterium]HPK36293.1 hypothetical protein [Oscillospiraceae bacterium]HPR75025.1 hypothetical protein [Oscillospiraceae bacterium]